MRGDVVFLTIKRFFVIFVRIAVSWFDGAMVDGFDDEAEGWMR